MSELPSASPIFPTPLEHPLGAAPTAEQFANRYAGLRAGRERAASELGGLAMAEMPATDHYGVAEHAGEGGDIEKLSLAIGKLLVDVGQRIGDAELVTDADTIFGVTPETIAAAEHARLNAQPVPSLEMPTDLNKYRNGKAARKTKSKRSRPQNGTLSSVSEDKKAA